MRFSSTKKKNTYTVLTSFQEQYTPILGTGNVQINKAGLLSFSGSERMVEGYENIIIILHGVIYNSLLSVLQNEQ